MKPLGLLLVGLLVINQSIGVDKKKFKTCSQSGFCKRLRDFKPERSQYVADFTSAKINENYVLVDVNTVDLKSEQKAVLDKYVLKISSLADSTFRVEMQEVEPLYGRYTPMLTLDGAPKPDTLTEVSKSSDKLVLENSKGHRVEVYADPLKIEFLDLEGETAVVMNENSQLLVEVPRERKEHEVFTETFNSYHDSRPRGNEAVSLDIGFPEAYQVYGIPEHTDKLNLATTTSGDPYRLFNMDVFEYELDSRMGLYGAVPVMYAHSPKRTVGVFWHNAAETWVDVVNSADTNVVSSIVNLVTGGSGRRVDARFLSEANAIDVFVLMGDTPGDAFRQYTTLTGVAPLPPKFSLGYHQCRWNYVDENDVRGVDENFDVHDIPVDVIWLDIEYTQGKKYFTWDYSKFPRPLEMVGNLTAKGRKMVIIVDTHIKREKGYFVHEELTEKGFYITDKDGKDYEGWCWPGPSSYIDFHKPEATKYYTELYRFDRFPGTTKDVHFWNDMNEPSVFNSAEVTMPRDCRHFKESAPEGATGLDSYWENRHVHNEYGNFHLRGTYQGMLDRTDGKYRTFLLTRAVFSGTQRFAAVWTGDNMAEWSHLAASVPMCLSLGVAGISFCGADIGGFFKYPDAELMTRWYQAGAYQPFYRAHSHIETKRREPWLYDEASMKLQREALRRRYTLIDFWYTLFYEHTRDGLPVMRPLFQEFPKEEAVFTIDDQYLLGNKLLVRPVTASKARSVPVYLPGKDTGTVWYDVDTYQRHLANGYIDQPVNIAKIPVYQRGGTIIARKERVRRASSLMADDPYTLIVALDSDNTAVGTIYIDDGETFEFEKSNAYIYGKFEFNGNELSYSFIDPASTYPSRSWLERVVVVGLRAPPRAARLQQAARSDPLHMTLHEGNGVLVVRKPGATMTEPWKIQFSY
uniref:Glucosidase II subunit alpha n=1 Tax=Glyphodes pyloalis TaxID=1242752 RepID=A0A345W861_GLYPY|nr:glucosidase II alpha-subunit [Glyphodes pyloalis]